MTGTALTRNRHGSLGENNHDTLTLVMAQVQRRLGIALALLVLGIFTIVASVVASPVIQYATGPQIPIVAEIQGQACGSHLVWEMDSRQVEAGSRVLIVNDSTYWQIPVVIEQQQSDGTFEQVAESPRLQSGESWSHTFWRSGTYRIVSADETQRLAGLDTTVSVQ